MVNKRITALKFKRRRKGLTDYRSRLALVKGGMLRVVVRKSNRGIIGQVAKYSEKGDIILKSADSKELLSDEYKWPSKANRPTAYLVGLLLAKKAKDLSNEEFVLDIGISAPTPNSVAFSFAKGFKDGGMKLRSGIDIPSNVYDGTLIAEYAAMLKKDDPEGYKRQFGEYIKKGVAPEGLKAKFEEVKNKIIGK